jgi:hypothetical protein
MSQGTKYRAQILLEPEQHKQLAEIAAREGRSVSHVVREAVVEYVTARTQGSVREKRLRGLENIKKLRAEILEQRGGKPIEIDPVELIRRMREERGDELFNVVSNRD